MKVFLLFLTLIASANVMAQSPAAIERTMLQDLEVTAKFGSYGSGYDEQKNDAANERIRAVLVKNGSRADILKYSFPKLKDRMYIATSPDGRFRIYSRDLETGGTMHDFEAVYQFQGKSGKVRTSSEKPGRDGYGGGFFTDVYQVNSSKGPIYLAVSTFVASTTLLGQSISAYTVESDKLVIEPKLIRTARGLTGSVGFEYDSFSVPDRPDSQGKLFSFDADKREFKFPVVIEDKEMPQGRVTDKFIRYRFDGKYFVKAV